MLQVGKEKCKVKYLSICANRAQTKILEQTHQSLRIYKTKQKKVKKL